MNRAGRLWVLVLSCSLSCSESKPDGEPALDAPGLTQLVGTIGPSGGVIEGPANSMFEGLKLEIAPGGLGAGGQVDIRITGVVESMPLPPEIEQLGITMSFEPTSATLAAPAKLTLPFDRVLLARLARAKSDVKVWIREQMGPGWTAIEPQSATSGSVTFALPRFTLVVVGVRIAGGNELCATLRDLGGCTTPVPAPIAVPASGPCTAPGGGCVDSIGSATSPKPETFDGFHAAGGGVYYLFNPPGGAGEAPKLDVARMSMGGDTPKGVVTKPFIALSNVTNRLRANLVADVARGDAVWVGLGNGSTRGTVRFERGANPARYDTTAHGIGGVIPAGTRFVKLASSVPGDGTPALKAQVLGAEGAFGAENRVPAENASLAIAAAPDVATPGAFWVMYPDRIDQLMVSGDMVTQLPAKKRVAATHGTLVKMAVAANGRIVAMAVSDSGALSLLSFAPGSEQVELLDLEAPVFDFAFAGDTLYASASTYPMLLVVEENEPGTIGDQIFLSEGLAGSPQFQARTPRGIQALADGSLVVLTQGRELLRVVPSARP